MATGFAIAIGKTLNGFSQLHVGSPKSFSSRSKQKNWYPDTPDLSPGDISGSTAVTEKLILFSRGDTFKVKNA